MDPHYYTHRIFGGHRRGDPDHLEEAWFCVCPDGYTFENLLYAFCFLYGDAPSRHLSGSDVPAKNFNSLNRLEALFQEFSSNLYNILRTKGFVQFPVAKK